MATDTTFYNAALAHYRAETCDFTPVSYMPPRVLARILLDAQRLKTIGYCSLKSFLKPLDIGTA